VRRLKRVTKKAPYVISGVSGAGIPEVLRALRGVIDENRQAEIDADKPQEAWHP